MRVRYDEGVATASAPSGASAAARSTAKRRQGRAQASHRAAKGKQSRAPTLPPIAEGNMNERANASARPARRGQRPWHVQRLLAREPGDLLPIRGARASPDRVGKARSRSRR